MSVSIFSVSTNLSVLLSGTTLITRIFRSCLLVLSSIPQCLFSKSNPIIEVVELSHSVDRIRVSKAIMLSVSYVVRSVSSSTAFMSLSFASISA